jgi:hypothetical protein
MIDRERVNTIKKKISKEFPEFKGIEPTITEKKIAPQKDIYRRLSLGVAKEQRRVYRLQFRKTVKTVDQVTLERILTVTLNEQGSIIKITQSR